MFNAIDKKYIALAINLSKKNIGLTESNPCVGCVIVKNDTIIATGITSESGAPHGETIAITKAKDSTKNATLYVTLEPCSHFGKTPPCVDLIIKSGISRVVISTIDPDLRVNGLGIKKLKEAGIEVLVGVLEDKAQDLNRGFFSAKTFDRPFITLKLATSFDGKIFDPTSTNQWHYRKYKIFRGIFRKDNLREGKRIRHTCSRENCLDDKITEKDGFAIVPQWISNEKSRLYAHYLRAKNDAILVGANTVRTDNPTLDCRIEGLEKYSPKRIIISSKLDINLNSKIIQTTKKIPTFLATNNSNTKHFSDLGIKIINFSNLQDLVKKLPNFGINNLLIEGGSIVATEFLKANLVDRLLWIKAPTIIGQDGINALNGFNINKINEEFNFQTIKTRMFDEDILTESSKKK